MTSLLLTQQHQSRPHSRLQARATTWCVRSYARLFTIHRLHILSVAQTEDGDLGNSRVRDEERGSRVVLQRSAEEFLLLLIPETAYQQELEQIKKAMDYVTYRHCKECCDPQARAATRACW